MIPADSHNQPVIQAKGLCKNFGETHAVVDLHLEVYPGEIFGLVGPDGAGKSTTLRMLATIMEPDSGSGSINGFDIASETAQVKDHLAYMSQKFGLYQDLTVRENLDFYSDLYGLPRLGRKRRESRMLELLEFSNMAPFIDRRAGNLSGGMKQKLQLACALIHTPKVLLLDEPTNGVDPVSRRDFWRILNQLRVQKVGILVTTAYLDEAERCDRVALIDKGCILAVGTPDEIKELMAGRTLAIRSKNTRELVEIMRAQPFVVSANIFGDKVHIVCPIEVEKTAVEKTLKTFRVEYDRVREIKPSLEDVFVHVLGEREAAEKPETDIPYDVAKITVATTGYSPKLPEEESNIAVEVSGLSRHFGSFTAVDSIDFQVTKGEIFGFLGPNGAGKSTTIRMLCGLLSPSSGGGRVTGFDILSEAEKIKHHIGYMSQKFSLYEDLTVAENINFYGGVYGLKGKPLEQRKEWALEMAGLQDHSTSLTRILSGGWKQRLALACSILHEPPIIFLDEPTSGVDPISRRNFWDLIYEMAEQNKTVFVTTHYMEEAEYCDRLGLIYNGKMIATGSPTELKTIHMHDEILDLRCSQPQELLTPLLELHEIKDVALFGAGLHLVTEDSQAARQSIEKVLTVSGRLEHAILEKIVPSMEDVFISLIEEVDQHNAKTKEKAGSA